jgi:hypothetical protein
VTIGNHWRPLVTIGNNSDNAIGNHYEVTS